ncbi:MAG: 3-deoxy-manno-octulosonate cytidylyltransferase [Bacteroidota bacterium]
MQSVIIIPARLKASRLPEKLLLPLNGKPILQWTYEACLKSQEADAVWIAVDDPQLLEACQQFTDKVRLTSPDHPSGTDRVAELAKTLEADFVVNVQGDEPFIEPELIDDIFLTLRLDDAPMVSAMIANSDLKMLCRPETVKVVTDQDGRALYFSRQLIPFSRDGEPAESYWQHIGIYGFRKDTLLQFVDWPPSQLEKLEKLEQLRALEHGLRIKMVLAQQPAFGIDTPEDYELARRRINSFL